MKWDEFVKIKPPLVLLILLLAATALHLFTPLKDVVHFRNVTLGWVLFLSGLVLLVSSRILFIKAKTTIIPAGTPSSFISSGPYRWTRNPIYIGASLLTFGIAFWVGSLPFFLVWFVLGTLLQTIYIPFEEANLEKVFGQTYLDYKARVRRWL